MIVALNPPTHAGQKLISDGARSRCLQIDRNPTAEDGRHVPRPGSHSLRQRNHCHVHADPAHDRGILALQLDLAPVTQCPVNAIRVAGTQGRQRGVLLGGLLILIGIYLAARPRNME